MKSVYNGHTAVMKPAEEFANGRRKARGNMAIEFAVDAMDLAEHIDPEAPARPQLIAARLERFRAKWIPVRVKKTRQNKRLEPRF